MTVTLVLRLVRECLDAGSIVGQAECVETGERATVRSISELLAFARGGDESRQPPGEETA